MENETMSVAPDELEILNPNVTDEIINPVKVILFNDDWHTFDEVTSQLIKATGCDSQRAEALTLEVHNRGKASVYDGDLPECLKVSSILEEISLHTQIEM